MHFRQWKRRKVISLLGGAAAWPLAARAQQAAIPTIGVLSGATFEIMRGYLTAFQRGLADAGFHEGRNVAVEYKWAEGHNDRLLLLATDLVRRKVNVILAAGSTPAAMAAKAATATIPIVFLVGTDPVQLGLVASLNRSGGNITGFTILNVELIAKCLELAHSIIPPAGSVAVLINPANVPQAATERGIVQDAARVLGRRVVFLTASTPSEIQSAFASLASEQVGGLVVSGETFFFTQRDRLVELAANNAVPTVYAQREYVIAGGLASYGADISDAYRHHVSVSTARILRGESAADLPVQQVTKVELILNLKTAKTLGLTFPITLLGRADEVIE